MPIRILDATTVSRIAAGEVIERPCSVVKELVENSLDAGSTAVTVEIRGGGIDYLRVTDNGCGIEPGQVRLAFENHATSKLKNADALDDIMTLGFRGEALPSIATVSCVEMNTRARNQESGTKLTVEGGEKMRVKETGCPEGTTIIIKDLFFNLPVRRAFLKKPSYEGSLVTDTVAKMIIGNPQISVRYINNGATVYHSFGDNNLRHAVFAVYGKETAEGMIEIDASEGGTRLKGLIGVGELAKQTRAHQHFFINGRSVRCPMLSRVLENVCKTRVTIGMVPMCALSLTLPATAVDVNVHPSKLEVRFRDEVLMQTVAEKLMSTAFEGEKVLDIARETVKPAEPVPETIVKEITLPKDTFLQALEQEQKKIEETVSEEKAVATLHEFDEKPVEQEKPVQPKPVNEPKIINEPKPVNEPRPVRILSEKEQPTLFAEEDKKPEWRIIGVAFKTYILIETQDNLLLIDQHAAHERLNYEKYMRELERGDASQMLLTPIIVRLSAKEMAVIRENMDAFESAGYAIDAFGENDIRISAVPVVLGKADLKPIFLEMAGTLSKIKAATINERRAEIMQLACKSAVKGGDSLTESEIKALVEEMLTTGAPPTCPHGRPVVKTLSRKDLEKMFKRIQ